MLESKVEKEIASNEIVEKYFRKKHLLLIYLASKEMNGKTTTVVDIESEFKITKKYAWALLGNLEEDNLVLKSEKVAIGGVEYRSYLTTMKAKRDLQTLSLCLNGYHVPCQRSKSPECPYSDELRMKITPKKSGIINGDVR